LQRSLLLKKAARHQKARGMQATDHSGELLHEGLVNVSLDVSEDMAVAERDQPRWFHSRCQPRMCGLHVGESLVVQIIHFDRHQSHSEA
jgi:hypothetical protein